LNSHGDSPSKRPVVTAVVGTGPYKELLDQRARRGLLTRAIRSWPSFTVDRWNADTAAWEPLEVVAFYSMLVRVVWASWRRVPWFGRHPTPKTLLFSLFDRMAASRLGDPTLLMGWAQVSLHSLRRARRDGAVAALEHPMLHVDSWQEIMRGEYSRYAPRAAEYYSLFPSALVRRMRAEYEAADYIVLPGSVARTSFIERGVPAERLVEIPFGIDTDYFADESKPRSSAFQVTYLSRLELLKGVHYLLEAWAALKLREARLSLAGAVLPEVHGILAKLAAQDSSVRVLGELPREAARQLLVDSDVVVFPSICDSFGLVVLEAMASGRTVIATSTSAGPDVIEDGVDGFVVPARDAKALGERLEWLYRHRDECAEMGRRARLKVTSRYDVRSYGDRLVRAYTRMLRRERPVSESLSAGRSVS
jgi:glycosyltransferase involved in cell wall biosynthesis